jgi:hypothetical protein
VDRIFPIGDFVEPSLIENWVSAFFAHFGQDPLAFLILKNLVGFGIVAALTLAWGVLGHMIGVIPSVSRDRFYKTPLPPKTFADKF